MSVASSMSIRLVVEIPDQLTKIPRYSTKETPIVYFKASTIMRAMEYEENMHK